MNAHPAGPRHAEEIHHGSTPPRPQTPAGVLDLAPNIWPHNLIRRPDGEVSIAGVSVAELAALRATINDAAGRPGSPMEVLLWVAFVFVVLVMLLSLVQNRLEKKWRIIR